MGNQPAKRHLSVTFAKRVLQITVTFHGFFFSPLGANGLS